MTPAERILWSRIRNSQINGLKFRRQQVIDGFIVDFFCPARCLVIEVDGDVHAHQVDYDDARQKALEDKGFKILRFSNNEVINETEAVLKTIYETSSPPAPLQTGERKTNGSESG